MYAFKLLPTPGECASCGRPVPAGMAGHYYQDPMCDACFRQAAPEVADAVPSLAPGCSIQPLDPRRHTRCADCRKSLLGCRFVGQHGEHPLCADCFGARFPEMAALLILHEAALEATAKGRDAPRLLAVAATYRQLLDHLDADDAGEPAEPVDGPDAEL